MESVLDVFNVVFISLPENPLDFFKKNFIMPSKDKFNGIRIDIAAGLTEFDKKVIERRLRKRHGRIDFYVCSIEDLIIYKLFAARYQDLADVKELIEINKNSIDNKYLINNVLEFGELERKDMIENLQKFLS